MTSSVIAWHRTMRTFATTSTEHERAFPLVCQRSLVFIRTHMHRGSSSKSLRHSPHLHVHGHLCGLFILILPFYFLLYLPPLFLFLKYLKSVVNLHNSCNETVESTDEFSLSTGINCTRPEATRRSREQEVEALEARGAVPRQHCGSRFTAVV